MPIDGTLLWACQEMVCWVKVCNFAVRSGLLAVLHCSVVRLQQAGSSSWKACTACGQDQQEQHSTRRGKDAYNEDMVCDGPACVVQSLIQLILRNTAKLQGLHQFVDCFLEVFAWEVPMNAKGINVKLDGVTQPEAMSSKQWVNRHA